MCKEGVAVYSVYRKNYVSIACTQSSECLLSTLALSMKG